MNIQRITQTLLLVLFYAVLSTSPALSQGTLKAGGGIGITSAVSDMNGSTMEYYNGSRYGLNSGMNILAKGKIGLSGMNLALELNYSSLNGTGNSEPGQGVIELTQKVYSVKFGPEIHLPLPGIPLSPYIGANIAWNRFSGEVLFRGVSKIASGTYTVREASRIGAGMTVGAEIAIAPLITLDLTTSYNFLNLSGAAWEDVNPGIDQRVDSYLSLNDRRDPFYSAGDDKHIISTDRTLDSMHFTVSILFGI